MSEKPIPTNSSEVLELTVELERLREENAQLRTQVAILLERIQELEARLAKDSHNSSKPPSSDPPFKKPAPRSLRQKSGRRRGGQKGHPGATRTLVDDPDCLEVMPLHGVCDCGRDLSGIAAELLPERRQLTELIIRREVTEYRTVTGTCACGRRHRSAFPETVAAPVQYGPGVLALAVHLTQYQLLPYQRTAELFDELAGIALSPATIHAAVQRACATLSTPVQGIRAALIASEVAHADETGWRVDGALHWLHVMSTETLTAYFAHPKRGHAALEAFGLLADFTGILVHDHWSAYNQHDGLHAFCNAHHLRELIGLVEAYPDQGWAERMIALLCEANRAVAQARADGLSALPPSSILAFESRYDDILNHGERVHPRRQRRPGQRGRIKQSPAYNLIARLRTNQEATLRFLRDFRVPFDNNQAERDLRLPKLKQKVSGCFRSTQGADAFATIRSYLSTLRKQSVNLLDALKLTFQGAPPMPRLG